MDEIGEETAKEEEIKQDEKYGQDGNSKEMEIISEEEKEEMLEESNGKERKGIEYEQMIYIPPLLDSPTLRKDTSDDEDEMRSDMSHRKEELEDER